VTTRGKFIVIDGLDGSGKTTVNRKVSQWLEQLLCINIVNVREPGGTIVGEKIRGIFKDGSIEREPTTELYLLMGARHELCATVIEKALAAGHWVIADRYWYSTYAYQGFGGGLKLASTIPFISKGLPKPDLSIWLDVSIEECIKRREADETRVGVVVDAIEGRGDDYFTKARSGYESLVMKGIMKRVDANQDPKGVMEDVSFLINELI